MKGKPWTAEEEKQLKQFLMEKKSVRAIARIMGKSRDCLRQKMLRLGLEVVVQGEKKLVCTTTTANVLPLPKELPSVEEALQILAGALEVSREKGLDKIEIRRLAVVATLARNYEKILANYMNYRAIEAKISEMEEKYERLLGEKEKDLASPAHEGSSV